jgi:quercetin dioxygenase-like cupin family protein
MPAVEPLPLDFGLGRFSEVGETEFWVANEAEQGYCGKFLFLFAGQTCPHHSHETKHETFFVVKGRVRMIYGEEECLLEAGDTLVMPPGTGHSFTAQEPSLLLEVSTPSLRGDNFFTDSSIGEEGVV